MALEAEFIANEEQVDGVIATYEASREWVQVLVDLPRDSINALPQAIVSQIILATCNPWTFDPVLGSTDALVGAGKLGVIRDPRLREALTTFENFVADAEEDVEYLRSFAGDIWRAQTRFGGPWTDPQTEMSSTGLISGLDFIPLANATDLLRVRSDQEYMGLVAHFHLNAAYYLAELRRIQGQVSTILDLIEKSR